DVLREANVVVDDTGVRRKTAVAGTARAPSGQTGRAPLPGGFSPLCGSKRELCARFLNKAHNGLGAPGARPPERSGATGAPRAEGARPGPPPEKRVAPPCRGALARYGARNENFVLLSPTRRKTGQAPQGRARRSGAGQRGPRERRRGGSAGAKPPGSSPLCGS